MLPEVGFYTFALLAGVESENEWVAERITERGGSHSVMSERVAGSGDVLWERGGGSHEVISEKVWGSH